MFSIVSNGLDCVYYFHLHIVSTVVVCPSVLGKMWYAGTVDNIYDRRSNQGAVALTTKQFTLVSGTGSNIKTRMHPCITTVGRGLDMKFFVTSKMLLPLPYQTPLDRNISDSNLLNLLNQQAYISYLTFATT